MKTIQQRNEYIQTKMKQHESITDVHKYQRRLKRLMRYHKLLTNLEVKQARENLRKALK
ncbi:hypothetical protein [Lysinibacillus pakistanensis]|uniref:30S ribosomal protein S15 n=1 Tax=Lysinibacillus pakistanensis TaxID=759811 RepID=A0AAX3WUL0_9BACI|nr:hypothetical protein [Lysinibacillus pakistanensis]MDM5229664.1 hypothetical protein [Lysinibacillus pakistanensis]WHY45236.1 hypothetical protein QNH22_18230 [Lysinibacillus pakistanensis]WHY50245.1 hypothetical protein QNH24_18195 [Lysinibacillus pakistanensis]